MIPFNPLIQPKDPSGKDTLSGVQKYLLRVIFGWAGKTVLHRKRLVEVSETHDSIRQLLPLMESDLSESSGKSFWVPRRASDKKRFIHERRKQNRLFRTLWYPPHFTGEPRPEAQTVTTRLEIPEDVYVFCKTLGYLENRLVTVDSLLGRCIRSSHYARPTREERKQLEERTRQKSDELRARLRERLLGKIIAESRLPEEKQLAVYDVLGLGQLIEQAAAYRRVPITSLGYTVRRIIAKVNQAYGRTLAAAETPVSSLFPVEHAQNSPVSAY